MHEQQPRAFITEEAKVEEKVTEIKKGEHEPVKHRFTSKEDREAEHVEKSEEAMGVEPKKAKSIGYATVQKQKNRKSHHKKMGRPKKMKK